MAQPLRKLIVKIPPILDPNKDDESFSNEGNDGDVSDERSDESASRNSEESISVEDDSSVEDPSVEEPLIDVVGQDIKIEEEVDDLDINTEATVTEPQQWSSIPLKPMTARQRAILGGAKNDKSVPLFQVEPKAQKRKGAVAPSPQVEIQAKKRKLKVQQKLEDEKDLVISQLLNAKYKPKNDNDDETDDPETATQAPPPPAKNDFKARILQDQKNRLRTKTRTGDFMISGPNETTITFVKDVPLILQAPQKFTQYPPPRPTCQAGGCKNPKLYNHKKTGLPVCSLACYKKLEAS